jgi:hypothetical protein
MHEKGLEAVLHIPSDWVLSKRTLISAFEN